MSFECEIDPKLFRSMIDAAATVVSEGNLEISEKGISMGAFDDGHVSLVTFLIPENACERFSCQEEVKLGVTLADISGILRRAKPSEVLTIKHDKEGANLIMTLQSDTKVREFSLKLIDRTQENIPNLDLPLKVQTHINPEVFSEAISDVAMVGDYVEIKADNSLDLLAADDERTKKAQVSIDKAELVDYKQEEVSTCIYPLEYLKEFTKGVKNAEDLFIGFSTDSPVRLLFKMPLNAHIIFLLAPRVESDDY